MRLQTQDDGFAPVLRERSASLNETMTSYRLIVDGHDVPYVTVSEWAVPEEGPKRAEWIAAFEDRSPHLMDAVKRGERIFNVSLDDRFGTTCPERELDRWAWFLANAMAVSAGFTSHGANSRPINRHGPSRI